MILVLKKGTTQKEMNDISEKLQGKKGVDTKKYFGVIKLKGDPLAIQQQMRAEW